MERRMKTRYILLPIAILMVTACQGGVPTDREIANAACSDRSIQSGCHQIVHAVMEEEKRQKREAAGLETSQHSYLENFETRPAILENPTGPARDTSPTKDEESPPNT